MDADFSHKKNVFVSLLNYFRPQKSQTYFITFVNKTAIIYYYPKHSNNIKVTLIRRHQLVEGGWLRKTPFPLKT